MSFKKHNPGCPCDCSAQVTDCNDGCIYTCDGTAPCPNLCAIRIVMPDPELVDRVEETDTCPAPDPDCPLSEKCVQCFYLFDGMLFFQSGAVVGVLNRRDLACKSGNILQWRDDIDSFDPDCANYFIKYELMEHVPDPLNPSNVIFTPYETACWLSTQTDCPDCAEELAQCFGVYGLTDMSISLSAVEVDGCWETTITIEYTVFEACNEPPQSFPNPPLPRPETTYTHTFKKTNQCECNEMMVAIPYDSTTSVNNSRNITLPDVCNVDEASVELIDATSQYCGTCSCYQCADQDQVVVSLSGTGFTGSVGLSGLLSGSSGCFFTGTFDPSDCVFTVAIELTIQCLECDTVKFILTMSGESESVGFATYEGTITNCGNLPVTLTLSSGTDGDCNVASYTVQVL